MSSQCLLGASSKFLAFIFTRKPHLAPILALGVVLMTCHMARAQGMPSPPVYPPAIEMSYAPNYAFTDDQGPVTLIGDGSGHYTGTYNGLITYGYPTIDYIDEGGYQWLDIGYWDYNNISGYDEDGNPIPTWVSDWEWVWVSDWEWVSGSATATAGFTFYVTVTLSDSGYMDYYAWAQCIYDTRSCEITDTCGVSSGTFDFNFNGGWVGWMSAANTDGSEWSPPPPCGCCP